jgi:hypothetical protein
MDGLIHAHRVGRCRFLEKTLELFFRTMPVGQLCVQNVKPADQLLGGNILVWAKWP